MNYILLIAIYNYFILNNRNKTAKKKGVILKNDLFLFYKKIGVLNFGYK